MAAKSQESSHVTSIARQIADYRKGAITSIDEAHVAKWATQLDPSLRKQALAELDHVLQRTYFSRARVTEFLEDVVQHEKFTGGDPKVFWGAARLLDIQQRGNSQRELNELLVASINAKVGLQPKTSSQGTGPFLYLDDAIFTGNHVRRDLEAWVSTDAPDAADVHIVVLGLHEGSYYHRGELQKAIEASPKSINLHWWRRLQLEDRKSFINESDVLRPRSCPALGGVKEYAASLKYDPVYRTQDSVGKAKIFSSEAGRHALEQAMLIAGVRARSACTALPPQHRPLGYHALEILGFGSMIVTYRNCPNNAPIALWAGDPWYPLFPRRTN